MPISNVIASSVEIVMSYNSDNCCSPSSYSHLFLAISIHIIELRHEVSNNELCVTSRGSDQPAHMCSLIRAFASRLTIL